MSPVHFCQLFSFCANAPGSHLHEGKSDFQRSGSFVLHEMKSDSRKSGLLFLHEVKSDLRKSSLQFLHEVKSDFQKSGLLFLHGVKSDFQESASFFSREDSEGQAKLFPVSLSFRRNFFFSLDRTHVSLVRFRRFLPGCAMTAGQHLHKVNPDFQESDPFLPWVGRGGETVFSLFDFFWQ